MITSIPITPLIDLTNSILCLFCALKLSKSYKKDKSDQVIKYFYFAYISLFVAYIFFSLPRMFFPLNSSVIGFGFIFAHIFLFLATGYFLIVSIYFINHEINKNLFYIFLFLSACVIVFILIRFPHPINNQETGITDWNIDQTVGLLITALFLIVLIPGAIVFFYQGFRSKLNLVKVRSLLIGCGLILLIIAAATFYSAKTQKEALISDIFSLSSFFVIFLGVYYTQSNKFIK